MRLCVKLCRRFQGIAVKKPRPWFRGMTAGLCFGQCLHMFLLVCYHQSLAKLCDIDTPKERDRESILKLEISIPLPQISLDCKQALRLCRSEESPHVSGLVHRCLSRCLIAGPMSFAFGCYATSMSVGHIAHW